MCSPPDRGQPDRPGSGEHRARGMRTQGATTPPARAAMSHRRPTELRRARGLVNAGPRRSHAVAPSRSRRRTPLSESWPYVHPNPWRRSTASLWRSAAQRSTIDPGASMELSGGLAVRREDGKRCGVSRRGLSTPLSSCCVSRFVCFPACEVLRYLISELASYGRERGPTAGSPAEDDRRQTGY